LKAIAAALTAWGPLGLFLLAVFDSAGIPLPAAVDALLVAAAAVNPEAARLGALLAVAGSLIGSMVLYSIARKGGQAYLDRTTAAGKGGKFRKWFQRYGLISVFIPALVPIPMPLKVFVISAGALGVAPLKFLLVVLAGRAPRYFGLALLGAQLGVNTAAWLKQHVWHMVLFSLILALTLGALIKLGSPESRYRKRP
jgi:membrane protein DedA with SNARE-associated domain